MDDDWKKRCVVVLAAAVITTGLIFLALVPWASAEDDASSATANAPATVPPPKNPLDGQRAYGYLQQICALGPRMSGSVGMQKQRELLQPHFEKLGGRVTIQRFLARNPLGGEKVPMANMIVEWHPERKERILLVAHYDTRPLPDRDPDPVKRKSGIFIGANDGGSGTALLMELAHLMPKLDSKIGVDFLLVDGEEYVYKDSDPYFLGSTWFAKQYTENAPAYRYRWGVVLDMVADRDLQIYQEFYSHTWRDTRPLVQSIWNTAAQLGVKEFIPRVGYDVRDDHLPLRNLAKIPTCDIIDFADPADRNPPVYWHTTADNVQRCSGASLAKVGWVVYEWLRGQQLAETKPQGAE